MQSALFAYNDAGNPLLLLTSTLKTHNHFLYFHIQVFTLFYEITFRGCIVSKINCERKKIITISNDYKEHRNTRFCLFVCLFVFSLKSVRKVDMQVPVIRGDNDFVATTKRFVNMA